MHILKVIGAWFRRRAEGAVFCVAIIVVGYLSLHLSNWWWYLKTGRTVDAAYRHVAEDHPEQAIPLLRAAIHDHPNDARLYYELGGAYLANGQEFPALAALTVYFRLDTDAAPGADDDRHQLARAAIEALWQYTENDSEEAVEPSSYAGDGISLIDEATVTYNQTIAVEWRKQVKVYTLQEILGQSALSPQSKAVGLITPALFYNSGLLKYSKGPAVPAALKSASLRDMVLSNTFSLTGPELGESCCSVGFDDPDLRQTPYVVKECLDNTRGLSEQARANRIINFQSRLGYKRRFVLVLIEESKL